MSKEFALENNGHILSKEWQYQYPRFLSLLPYKKRTKGRVIFMWDDTNPEDYTKVKPLFEQYHIPYALACNAGRISSTEGTRWGDEITDKEAAYEMITGGAEIINHGLEHRNLDAGNYGFDTVEEFQFDEVVNGRKELEEMGFNVRAFWARGGSGISYDDQYSFKANLIRSSHPISLGLGGSDKFDYPFFSGAGRVLLDKKSLAELQEKIDIVVAQKTTIIFYGHAANWDAAHGDEKFDSFLSYVKFKIDANELEVTTTNGLLIKGDIDDVNFIPEPSSKITFDSWDDPANIWSHFSNVPEVDSNYLKFGANINPGVNYGGISVYPRYSFPVSHVMVDCLAKAPTGTTAHLRIRNDPTGTPAKHTFFEVGDSWERIRTPIGYVRNEETYRVVIWSTSPEVHVKDIKIYPI